MNEKYIVAAALAGLILAGCDSANVPENHAASPDVTQKSGASAKAVAGTPHRFADWAGRWSGVEGLYAEIIPTTPESYRLVMQYDLDHQGEFLGRDSEHGIIFSRNGETLSLRRGSGDDSGLKYLAGKQDCLIVKEGEGYCRD